MGWEDSATAERPGDAEELANPVDHARIVLSRPGGVILATPSGADGSATPWVVQAGSGAVNLEPLTAWLRGAQVSLLTIEAPLGVPHNVVEALVDAAEEAGVDRFVTVERAPSSVPADAISEVVSEGRADIQRCYETWFAEQTAPARIEVGIRFRVDPSGEVSGVWILTPLPERVEQCLTTVVQRWRFPEATEQTKVTIPIVFRRRATTISSHGLSAEQLSVTVNSHRNEMRDCYNSWIREQQFPQRVEAVVRIDIALSGAVQDVQLVRPVAAPLASCLTTRVRRWQFPASTRSTTINVPFIFHADPL